MRPALCWCGLLLACSGGGAGKDLSAVALELDDGLRVVDRSGTRVALESTMSVASFDGDLDAYNWDPWWLDSDSPLVALVPLPEIIWTDGELRPHDEGYAVDAAGLSITVERESGLVLVVRAARDVPYIKLALRHGAQELLYGSGNLHDGPLLNGRRLPMQLEADPSLEVFYNERHVVVPLVVSSAGWGMWVETKRAQRWDSRYTTAARPAGQRSGPERPSDTAQIQPTQSEGRLEIVVGGPVREVLLHVFLADHPLDIYRQYYRASGLPRVPPAWAFGPWIWRDETPGQGAPTVDTSYNPGVMHDLAAIEALALPTSAYWIDRPYATALNTFDFSDDYDDPVAMLDYARARGLRMALWHTPYVVPAAGAVYDDISKIEGFPEPRGLSLNTFGATPIDLTRDVVRSYWVQRLQDYIGLGIEGFKLDFAEDVVHGLPGLRTNPWGFADGSDERTQWHDYAGLYHATYREALTLGGADGGGFILARAGRAGGHAAVDVLWPGDLDADFARHGEDKRVGGIPAALSYALSTSASGYPFFAADTGGYRHGPPDDEAYRRWFELTSVMPVMQVGGSDNQVPWERDHFGWDDRLLDDYRVHASLHLRLYPYVKTLADALRVDGDGGGRPLVRPLGLAHPECGVEPGDQYLLGESLLVAPVVASGVVRRQVLFPPGRWVSWWTGDVTEVDACTSREIDAPLGRVPLWLRGGTLVPMLRPGAQTLAPVTAGARDSAADTPGPLWVEVGGPATFEAHDGTRLAVVERGAGTWELSWVAGRDHLEPPVWTFWSDRPTQVHDADGPLAEVTASDAPAPRTWSHAAGRLQVHAAAATVIW